MAGCLILKDMLTLVFTYDIFLSISLYIIRIYKDMFS